MLELAGKQGLGGLESGHRLLIDVDRDGGTSRNHSTALVHHVERQDECPVQITGDVQVDDNQIRRKKQSLALYVLTVVVEIRLLPIVPFLGGNLSVFFDVGYMVTVLVPDTTGKNPIVCSIAPYLNPGIAVKVCVFSDHNLCVAIVVNIGDDCHFHSQDEYKSCEQHNPCDQLQEEDFKQVLAEKIGSLPEREKMVMALYYDEEFNLREIGEILGITEGRVCQIHGQALLRLRSRMTSWVDDSR